MKKAILCVDDEALISLGMSFEITQIIPENFVVKSLFFSSQVIPTIEKLELDNIETVILISDWNMPKMNGVQLFTLVKEKYPKIKFILVSAYKDENLIKTDIDFTFIPKPWDKELVKKVVLDMINTLDI